jgi:hypothetical protein
LRCINKQYDIETQHLSDRPVDVLVQVRQSNVHFDRAKALHQEAFCFLLKFVDR